MRIIAGERKGFMLRAPSGLKTRPTLGRVRESLFSILGGRVIDARVADLFAGAGGLGLEALSRGAASCTFVDNSRQALDALRANIAKLRYEEQSRVAAMEVLRWLHTQAAHPAAFDLVFADPPYGTPVIAQCIAAIGNGTLVVPEGLLVFQAGVRDALPETAGTLQLVRSERYGESALHFYQPQEQ